MCGKRRIVEGKTVEQLFTHDNADRVEAGRGMIKGKEVDEVPLCRPCVGEIQTGSESVSDEHLIPLALARVDKFDGGLSRRRWEAHRKAENTAPNHPIQHDTATPEEIRRPPSPIYVDIHNPMESSAFKRSPTKPIPRWMQYLPSARREQDEPRTSSPLDNHFFLRDSTTAISNVEARPPPVPPHNTPAGPPPPVPPHTTFCQPTVPTYMPVQMCRPFTLITEEPVQRPSSARGPLPGSKHVRFDGVLGPTGPSASAEYLERYIVGKPVDVKSEFTVTSPTGLDGNSQRVGVWSSPISGRGEPQQRASGCDSVVSGTREENESSSEATTVNYCRSGASDPAYGTGEYSTSAGSSAHSVESLVGKRGRPLGMTFQDQLKRVFGFN